MTIKETGIEWKEEYSVGIDEIDEQHQHLLNLINMLLDARKNILNKKDLKNLFIEFMNYSQYHFETEEKYFNDSEFENHHKAEHSIYTNHIMKLAILFLKNDEKVDASLLFFLLKWLKKHILITDRETFGALINSK